MNTEQKTPADWFKMLKEPYRSEAIANIDSECINLYYKSISDALSYTFSWVDTPQGDKQWVEIQESIKAGETTYLETELKPQDMISGEWYGLVCKEYKFLIQFNNIKNDNITYFKGWNLTDKRNCIAKYICSLYEIKSIRPATREDVLEHFPDEFKDENKEVESEEEIYFYSIDHINLLTGDLQDALNDADNGTIIYKATPIGTKQTKSILEPIKK